VESANSCGASFQVVLLSLCETLGIKMESVRVNKVFSTFPYQLRPQAKLLSRME